MTNWNDYKYMVLWSLQLYEEPQPLGFKDCSEVSRNFYGLWTIFEILVQWDRLFV